MKTHVNAHGPRTVKHSGFNNCTAPCSSLTRRKAGRWVGCQGGNPGPGQDGQVRSRGTELDPTPQQQRSAPWPRGGDRPSGFTPVPSACPSSPVSSAHRTPGQPTPASDSAPPTPSISSQASHPEPQASFYDPGIEPASLVSPALAGRFFTTGPLGKPNLRHQLTFNLIKQRWSSTLLLYRCASKSMKE